MVAILKCVPGGEDRPGDPHQDVILPDLAEIEADLACPGVALVTLLRRAYDAQERQEIAG